MASKEPPQLPRNIACAINLKAKDMEETKHPAALLLVPQKCTLVAFRRDPAGTGGNKMVVTVARWSGAGSDSSPTAVVNSRGALHLHLDVPPGSQQNASLEFLLSPILCREREGARKVLLTCAVLEALLENRLSAAEMSSVLHTPDALPQYVFCDPVPSHVYAYENY